MHGMVGWAEWLNVHSLQAGAPGRKRITGGREPFLVDTVSEESSTQKKRRAGE